MSARRDGDVGALDLDGESVRCAFPLVVKVAGRLWAIAIPLAQLGQPTVDVYVFAATKVRGGHELSPAPDEGFEALKAALTKVEPIER